MSAFEWKMCNFYKLELLNVNTKYDNIKNTITSHCNNLQYKIFCSTQGAVYVFLGDWECISFQASNNAINICTVTDDSDLLVILDECAPTESVLKIYSLSKLLKRKPPLPVCCATIAHHHKATVLKAHFVDSQLLLAVGLEKGNILLYKSVIARDISANYKTLHVGVKPIKGIEFLPKERDIYMFVSSDAGVFRYNLSTTGGNYNETKVIADDKPAIIYCSTLTLIRGHSEDKYFVVGKEDALYCYTAEGRGPCFAIKGAKQIVKWFGKHIIVLTSQHMTINNKKTSQLVIINIESNMIEFNEELSDVEGIFPTSDYDNCLIFMKDGSIFTLRDQEIRYKLQLLYSKNLYDTALKLVDRQMIYPDLTANVYVRYGDHLLQRGDIVESVKMYIKTIGEIPPFRIISKLLNIRHNEFLIKYLRNLIESAGESQEYSNLLKNCDRRFDLPDDIDKIFRKDVENSKFGLYPRDPVRSGANYVGSASLSDEKNGTANYPEINSNNEIEIFSEIGNWIISNYPLDLDVVLKYILSNKRHSQESLNIFIQILLPLLLSNKDCVLDILTSPLCFEYKKNPSVNIVWSEILLQKWKSAGIDVSMLMDFIREHEFQLSMNDIYIISRTHKYWPGIKMMYEHYGLSALNFHCFLNCCNILPLDKSSIDIETNKYSFAWMKALNKDNLQSTQSSAFVKYVLNKTLQNYSHHTLPILQKIAANKHFSVSHLNKAIPKDIFLKHLGFNDHDDVIAAETKLTQIKKLLMDYQQKPIEFRNSTCDLCKQPLKPPSIYYLCQHSYHKECISTYAEITCLACENIATNIVEKKASFEQDSNQSLRIPLKNISHKLSVGVISVGNNASRSKGESKMSIFQGKRAMGKVTKNKMVEIRNVSTNPFENTGNNPLENKANNQFENTAKNSVQRATPLNQYDMNLNPFEGGNKYNSENK